MAYGQNRKGIISAELKPVLDQLHSEGIEVYTYMTDSDEVNSLFWFENGRVLNIQPSLWRNERYARDSFNIGVSYVPSHKNGSGCGLSNDDCGTSAEDLLSYRKNPTWVHGSLNYGSMEYYLKKQIVLEYYEI